MNQNQSPKGKVLLHGSGIGGVTESDVRRRALELAGINGLPVSEKFLAQARRELTGEDLPSTTTEDIEATAAITRDPSEPPSDSGHRVEDIGEPDEQEELELLTEEGVEEAQHEQMIAAQRQARHDDKK